MGFLSGLFSKEACVCCGKEVGALSRTKLKDGAFVCSDCVKECSYLFKPVLYSLEEYINHLKYMQFQDELYKYYQGIDDSKKISVMKDLFSGIIFADEIGMFEVINKKSKEAKHKELFRYDDIMDFKMYGIENPEGSPHKYKEVGIKIKMMTNYVGIGGDYHTKHKINKYADEFTIPLLSATDSIGNIKDNLACKHLNLILGIAIEGKLGVYGDAKEVRTEYRGMSEINRLFNREKYSVLADEAERKIIGMTVEEKIGK